jgi:hypothetical protein
MRRRPNADVTALHPLNERQPLALADRIATLEPRRDRVTLGHTSFERGNSTFHR